MSVNPLFLDMTQEEYEGGKAVGLEVFKAVSRMIGFFASSLRDSYFGFKEAKYGEVLGFDGGVPSQIMEFEAFSLRFKREMVTVSQLIAEYFIFLVIAYVNN